MTDSRIEKFAHTLIHYSLSVEPGDKMVISSTPLAAPLVEEVYREALRTGAHPSVRITLDRLAQIQLREATDDQLRFLSDITTHETEYYDCSLSIAASENTVGMSGIDPRRLALSRQAYAPLMKRQMERAAAGEFRWCGTLFPTNAHAQDAGISLSDYEDFVFSACLLDHDDPAEAWREVHRSQQRVIDFLSQHDEIHITAPGTDITYRAGGRTWINSSGARNFPSGEVFTGPIEDSAEGVVTFSYPAVYNANEVEGVRLRFEKGKVVEATAEKGQQFLDSMLDMDSGARYLGEAAFGLNYGIERFTRNILFDEKIGGSMHLALGKSYPDTGGVNESGLHWDMICDLSEGKVYADAQLCYEAGTFSV